MIDGIINLDKPCGISSARAVSIVKRLLPRGNKIGHAGTLDPFASGVLLLLLGRGTKSCEQIMNWPKSYEAIIRLGATTATDDPESPEVIHENACQLTLAQIEATAAQFVGKISQRPPIYSAMKIGGRRAYQLARGGQEPILKSRPVIVHSLKVLDYQWPRLGVSIECSRGTYIRSIARDLGDALHVGGYLIQLRRTRIGEFDIDRAVTLDDVAATPLEKIVQPIPTASSSAL